MQKRKIQENYGKHIVVDNSLEFFVYFVSQQQEQDPTNLYISNLPAYLSEVDLEVMFSSYGKVISTRILRDPHGTSRGVGFARMDTKETCDAIIDAFNGKYLNGSHSRASQRLSQLSCRITRLTYCNFIFRILY